MPTSANPKVDTSKASSRPPLVAALPRSKRGRPPLLSDGEKRKRRNVSLSDDAWENLEKIANELSYSSKSELLEKIGRGDVTLSKQGGLAGRSSLSEVLVYRRLLGLFVPHSDVLRSFVGFNYAVYKKFPTLEAKQSFAELIVENTLTAISVVFLHGYIRPDRYVNSISALSRLIGYCLLLDQASLGDEWELSGDSNDKNELSVDSSAKDCLAQIQRAMSHLKAASFSHQLTALRLKYIGSFTEAQIQQIYELQGRSFTIEEIRRLVHEGWASFRNHWSQPSEIAPPPSLVEIPCDAERYCKLLWSSSLDSAKSRKALMRILIRATYDAPLNFWLCEIEHKWNTEFLGEDSSLDDELSQLQAEIQSRIDERLEERKQAIDKDMHYYLDRSAAIKKLADLFEEETGISQKTQLGDFMINLLRAEAEERYAMKLTGKLKLSRS
ncbi:MAG: CopG family transcriptional regulator [Cyanobacteria bacterium P01_D01_bin.105]